MMPGAFDILHADNWCVLTIAILYCKYLNPEDAFQVFMDGSVAHGLAGSGKEKVSEMIALRATGMRWKDIGEAVGIKNPQHYVCRWRKSNRMADPAAEALAEK